MSRIVASSPASVPAWRPVDSSSGSCRTPTEPRSRWTLGYPRGPFRLLQPLMRRELATFLANLPEWIRTGLESAYRPTVG